MTAFLLTVTGILEINSGKLTRTMEDDQIAEVVSRKNTSRISVYSEPGEVKKLHHVLESITIGGWGGLGERLVQTQQWH